jgi:sporulation protein YlmC with PRC-barrel domain
MEVTHVVVRSSREELMVPLNFVMKSSPEEISLNCSLQELNRQERFVRMQYLGAEEYDVEDDLRRMATESDAIYWPYRSIDDNYQEIYGMVEQIPHNELAIHRGSVVEASDGHIGRVDEFIVDQENHHITHLVLLRGHLWGKKDVTIPINEIDRIDEDVVYLKLDKNAVKSLPTVPVRRKDRN